VNRQLQIEKEGEKFSRSPEDLDYIVLDHQQIYITQGTLLNLLRHNVQLIYCDEHHMPVAVCQPLSRHHLPNKRVRLQLNKNAALKDALWKSTMKNKIGNQAYVLQLLGQNEAPLLRWRKELKNGDPTNVEAKASKYYWRYLFSDLFSSFKRGRYESCPNNLLNYGYALLRSAVSRGIVTAGFIPQVGIHHHNQYNPYCLADDLMEPYRPFVDLLVLDALEEFNDIGENLSIEHRAYMLQLYQMSGCIGDKMYELPRMIAMTCESLYQAFLHDKKNLAYGAIHAEIYAT